MLSAEIINIRLGYIKYFMSVSSAQNPGIETRWDGTSVKNAYEGYCMMYTVKDTCPTFS